MVTARAVATSGIRASDLRAPDQHERPRASDDVPALSIGPRLGRCDGFGAVDRRVVVARRVEEQSRVKHRRFEAKDEELTLRCARCMALVAVATAPDALPEARGWCTHEGWTGGRTDGTSERGIVSGERFFERRALRSLRRIVLGAELPCTFFSIAQRQSDAQSTRSAMLSSAAVQPRPN